MMSKYVLSDDRVVLHLGDFSNGVAEAHTVMVRLEKYALQFAALETSSHNSFFKSENTHLLKTSLIFLLCVKNNL